MPDTQGCGPAMVEQADVATHGRVDRVRVVTIGRIAIGDGAIGLQPVANRREAVGVGLDRILLVEVVEELLRVVELVAPGILAEFRDALK